jgi:DNA (cytosine-5)-methyltransferase 1
MQIERTRKLLEIHYEKQRLVRRQEQRRKNLSRVRCILRKRNSLFTFIDLFAGIGGLRQAATYNGGKCVFSSEIDEKARNTYFRNYGETPHGDITKIHAKDIPPHDMLLGGFPCQPFSLSGLKKGFADTRGTLFFEIVRIARHHRPRILVLENVKNLSGHDKGKTLDVIKKSLENIGYTVSIKVLNAVDYGVAQNRERTIIVASTEGKFDFEWMRPLPRIAVRNVIYGKHKIMDEKDYTLIPKHKIKKYNPSGMIFLGYLNRNRRCPETNDSNVSAHRDSNRIFCTGGASSTLIAERGSRNYFLHKNRVINLNLPSLYALQGFPKNFKIHPLSNAAHRQIGNSIAIPLFQQVVNEVCKQGLLQVQKRKAL